MLMILINKIDIVLSKVIPYGNDDDGDDNYNVTNKNRNNIKLAYIMRSTQSMQAKQNNIDLLTVNQHKIQDS